MSDALKVDVWSDIACPWCYIGKRRFEEGVRRYAERGGLPVEVEYHSFQLMPGTPDDVTASAVEFLAEHLRVTPEQAGAMAAQVTRVAAAEGLDFDYGRQRPANTARAHEVLHLAKGHDAQAELKERLLRAHWTEGRDVGDVDELVALAADAGLNPVEVRAALDSGRFADAVAADIAAAREIGVTGVPFFVVDGRYAVSGAQEAEVFARSLEHAAGTSRVA